MTPIFRGAERSTEVSFHGKLIREIKRKGEVSQGVRGKLEFGNIKEKREKSKLRKRKAGSETDGLG